MAIRSGLAKIIEKVYIPRYFGSPETDYHRAANAGGIKHTDTGSS
jgi:hypothetical protein